jgi:hypothetical protein
LAKKKNVEKPKRQFTKRQLSHIKRQKRRQNLILYGGIFIIVAVIVIVFVGLYLGEIRPYHQTALKVYDREFNVRYYMDSVEYYYKRLYGSDIYSQYLSTFVGQVPSVIIQAELVKHAAEELGIAVSNDEVKDSLKENEQPVNDASIDLARLTFLEERLLGEYFKPQVPVSANQVYMMAMALGSESEVFDITDELASSDNFTGLAEENSLNTYTKNQKGDLGWHSREYLESQLDTTVPVEYAFDAEIGSLSPPLYDESISKSFGYWVVNVLERQEDGQAYVQVILLGTEEEADEIILRLEDGEDFGELAMELSQDDDSREAGGELGWISSNNRTEAFDTHVFDSEMEELGILEPFRDDEVSTDGAYWLVEVVDREEDRPREEEETEYFAEQYYSDWVSQLWEDATDYIDQTPLTLEMLQWIIEKLQEE